MEPSAALPASPRLANGMIVRVRAVGESQADWIPAVVMLASDGGRSSQSIVLDLGENAIRAARGMFVGVLPLLIDYERGSVMGLTGDEYEIEVKG